MRKTTILIVDDEPDIIEILKFNLEKEDFNVVTASNGTEGIEKAVETNPDLIVLDIMMPEMERGKTAFKDVLIAFLTAREEDYSQIAALDVGGDDYITKPIRPRVLVSRIKALLRRKGRSGGNETETIMTFGDLEINRENFSVIKDGTSINLAKKEFELLSLLSGRPGKVFSREEIFRKIWGTDVIVGNRTIDVHVRKLREKIGEHYIKTMKGIGYKFEF